MTLSKMAANSDTDENKVPVDSNINDIRIDPDMGIIVHDIHRKWMDNILENIMDIWCKMFFFFFSFFFLMYVSLILTTIQLTVGFVYHAPSRIRTHNPSTYPGYGSHQTTDTLNHSVTMTMTRCLAKIRIYCSNMQQADPVYLYCLLV